MTTTCPATGLDDDVCFGTCCIPLTDQERAAQTPCPGCPHVEAIHGPDGCLAASGCGCRRKPVSA